MPYDPKFSIIIPTYNRAHLIGKTIASVLRLDFEDFEVLVVDDGSRDNTAEVVTAIGDGRLHYFKKENAERGAARNFGARKAKGEYVNFFDSDDLMYPNHLRVAGRVIEAAGSPEFIHLAYDYRLEDGELQFEVSNFDDTVADRILFDNKLSCNGVFLRRDIALKYPFVEERELASSEDWELWIRLLCRFRLHYSNEITSSVINHDQRSLRTIAAEKVVTRDLLFIAKLEQDDEVMRKYGRSFRRFVAERYTFFMLCFASQGQGLRVLRWGIRAFAIHPLILTSKRFLASIKNCIIK